MILKATLGWGSQKASIASGHPSADRGPFQISFIPILARMQQAAQSVFHPHREISSSVSEKKECYQIWVDSVAR